MIIGAVIRILIRLFKSRQNQNGSDQQRGGPGQAPAQNPDPGLGMRQGRRRQRRF